MLTVAAPRPILKPCSSSQDSYLVPPSPQQPHHQPRICHSSVQFSPCISTTYFTHGKSDYNRCPIAVTPNSCALTKRKYVVDELANRPSPPSAMSPPALVFDDGVSSDDSEEYDSMPPTPTYSPPPTPSYIIPASLLKSNATRARRSSSSYSSIPKSSPPRYCPEYDARDDIFGGF